MADDNNYSAKFRGFESDFVALSDAVPFISIALMRSTGAERNDRIAGRELYNALRADELTAYGARRKSEDLTRIPVSDFPQYAQVFGGSAWGDSASSIYPQFNWRENRERHVRTGDGDVIDDRNGLVWRNICVRRDDLIAKWPQETPQKTSSHSPPLERTPSKKPTKPEQIAEFLKNQFPQGRPPLTKKELEDLIREEAPEIGRFAPRTLSTAVELAYSNGGTARKSAK